MLEIEWLPFQIKSPFWTFMCSMAVIASDYLLGVAVVVAVGELVAEVVGTDKRLMDSGSTSRSPMSPFLEACFRT